MKKIIFLLLICACFGCIHKKTKDKDETRASLESLYRYYTQGNYEKAEQELQDIPDSLFSSLLLKSQWGYKLLAKIAANKGDSEEQDRLYGLIISDLEQLFSQNKQHVDSMMVKHDLLITEDSITKFVPEYYYFKSKINGLDEVVREIESKQWNEDFRDYLIAALKNDELLIMFK